MSFLPGMFPGAPSIVAPAYIGQDDDLNANTTHTFAGLVPARLHQQRYVLALAWADASPRTIDSVTIAGVTATARIARAVGSETEVVILDAVVPGGAAGDVVVNLSGFSSIDTLSASLFTVGDYSYRTGGSDTGVSTASLAGIAVNAGEYAIGIAAAFEGLSGAAAFTWTNLTERDDVDIGNNRVSSASAQVAAAGTLTVTAVSSGADEITAVVAVYAP